MVLMMRERWRAGTVLMHMHILKHTLMFMLLLMLMLQHYQL